MSSNRGKILSLSTLTESGEAGEKEDSRGKGRRGRVLGRKGKGPDLSRVNHVTDSGGPQSIIDLSRTLRRGTIGGGSRFRRGRKGGGRQCNKNKEEGSLRKTRGGETPPTKGKGLRKPSRRGGERKAKQRKRSSTVYF